MYAGNALAMSVIQHGFGMVLSQTARRKAVHAPLCSNAAGFL
jgi:hypothetical protein